MTITNETARISYSCDGSTTVFPYTFRILDEDHLDVILVGSDGTQTTLTKTTDYTVSGVGDAGGGNVTTVITYSSAWTLLIKRDAPLTQLTDYVEGGPFSAVAHENALDLLCTQIQQVKDSLTYTETVAAYPPGYLYGMTLANNSTDGDHDINITAGAARDDANAANLDLSATMVKSIDGAWAAWSISSATGGLDTGTVAADTWYHVFLIRNPTTGAIDGLFSTSLASPTMPSGFTQKRRLGSVRTDSSSNILAFYQYEDEFYWDDPPAIESQTVSVVPVTFTPVVPTGLELRAIINLSVYNASVHSALLVQPSADLAPHQAHTTLYNLATAGGAAGGYGLARTTAWTNTSAQLKLVASAAATTVKLSTLGWIDSRGRLG